MKNGECPRCGSHEISASTTGPGSCPEDWRWNVAPAHSASISLDDQTLLCAACGCSESYLRNPEVVADIVAHDGGSNWVKPGPARSSRVIDRWRLGSDLATFPQPRRVEILASSQS